MDGRHWCKPYCLGAWLLPCGDASWQSFAFDGLNELQHQVYGRIRQFGRDEDWTLDSFLDGLLEKAEFYGISGDLGWAIKSAIASMN